jgi:hypothetical protein
MDRSIYSEGVTPASFDELPVSKQKKAAIVKLTRSGAFSSTGFFISEDGLLVTTYNSVIEDLARMSSPNNLVFEKGFVASSQEEEFTLTGHNVLIETEQTDVTERVKAGITDSSMNYQIFTMVDQEKKALAEERKAGDPTVYVEISDIYSGNRHLMSVYNVLPELRLVYAPPVSITAENISSGSDVLDAVNNEYVILRAYNEDGTPYSPTDHFELTEATPTSGDSLTALGYPTKTFRLDSRRTVEFYYGNTNPYILDAYKIYQRKEDSLASLDPEFALSSLKNRFTTEENIRYYSTIQRVIAEDSIVQKKALEEEAFMEWAKEDSSRMAKYSGIFGYIDQAINIAEQTGDILFSTSYFTNLSLLDDLNNQFRAYLQQQEEGKTEEELRQIKSIVLQNQQQILDQIDIKAEMNMLADFVYLVQSVPESQRPLAIYDLFTGLSEENKHMLIGRFIDEQIRTSFIFDPAKASEVIDNERFYNDPLFVILDEISSTMEFARTNYNQHYAYLVPAQQVLTKGKMAKDPDMLPDAVNVLSFNNGSLDQNRTSDNSDLFYATIDFSGKAPGTVILNQKGIATGMITSELTSALSGNYFYQPESVFVKARSIPSILNELKNDPNAAFLMEEINR